VLSGAIATTMSFWPGPHLKAPWNETFAAPASDRPNIWAMSLRGPLVAVVNIWVPPANAIIVSAELDAVLSTAQPLIVTRSLSLRLIHLIAPFTSGVPRRPAVCTAAIKLRASETVAFAKIATPGGTTTGLVSHSTTANPRMAAEVPDIHMNHRRVRMCGLEGALVVPGDLSDTI